MTMGKWQDTVQNATGDAQLGAVVTVRVRSSGALATLYLDDETTTQSNPLTTGADGKYGFCAADNVYDITIVKNGVTTTVGHVVLGGTSGSSPTVMVASGAGHAAGYAPDPGSSAGTTKFLREDATWQIPAGGGGSTPTGTGFRHVTSGTEDGAAVLVVNADVSSSAGIALSKLATQAAHTITMNNTGSAAAPIAATLTQAQAELGDWNANVLKNFLPDVIVDTSTARTLSASERGRVLTMANASAIAVTLHATAEVGYNVTINQVGAGAITFTAAGSGTLKNRQSHTKTAGQDAVVTLFVRSNAGSAAVWVLGGDTTA